VTNHRGKQALGTCDDSLYLPLPLTNKSLVLRISHAIRHFDFVSLTFTAESPDTLSILTTLAKLAACAKKRFRQQWPYWLPDTSKLDLFCRTELLDRATFHRNNSDWTKDVELTDQSQERFVTVKTYNSEDAW
jgi:hypothetical protein